MRFIYNTTFSIDENIAEEFIQVVQGGYIAYLKSKNLCNDILFTRVMIREGERPVPIPATQYFPSAEEYTHLHRSATKTDCYTCWQMCSGRTYCISAPHSKRSNKSTFRQIFAIFAN